MCQQTVIDVVEKFACLRDRHVGRWMVTLDVTVQFRDQHSCHCCTVVVKGESHCQDKIVWLATVCHHDISTKTKSWQAVVKEWVSECTTAYISAAARERSPRSSPQHKSKLQQLQMEH
jgi:hypothetical protein